MVKMIGGLSLRARIVLWILLLFLIIQVTLSLVVLLYARQDVQRSLNRSLEQFAGLVEAEVATWDNVPDRDRFETVLAATTPSGFGELYGVVIDISDENGGTRRLIGGALGDELAPLVDFGRLPKARARTHLHTADVPILKQHRRVRSSRGEPISI
ncbi:MAG: hypothetical protein AAFO89_06630, partial [Planctomycetota bacterium]